MIRLLILTLMSLCLFTVKAAVELTGGAYPPVEIEAASSTGLNNVWVVYSVKGMKATYKANSPTAKVVWMKYSSMGGGYAEEITKGIERNGGNVTLTSLESNMGYIVEEDNRRYCFWIADYSTAPFRAESIEVAAMGCETAELAVKGTGARMDYYSVTGRSMEIDRAITVAYRTLEYSSDNSRWEQVETVEQFSYLHDRLTVASPLCDTRFTLSGDRFLTAWGLSESIESASANATAVAAQDSATQNRRESDNEQSTGNDDLGGSAPAEIEFSAEVTDAAIFTEWQIASDPEFNLITIRVNDPVMTYTFHDSGTTYVRFECANADGSCSYTGQTYRVNIGDSDIKCPNAFSPGASEGVNDEWRVSYKSIISFDCHIFNRQGKQMAHLTDPSQGWNGKSGGKLVPPGVYYYVITAKGADGRDYKLSGDINVVGFK